MPRVRDSTSIARRPAPLGRRPRAVRERLVAVRAALRRRWPVPDAGDMRRVYRATRTAVGGLLLALALLVGVRLALTGLFVAHVSADLPLVTAFNVGVSVLTTAGVLGVAAVNPTVRRLVWRRLPTPVRLGLARRRRAGPPRCRDRL